MMTVTPIPEAIQSLPPVTIRHIMEGPNPWVAFVVAVGVSVVAVIIATVTLSMVYCQIKIANRQLRVAYKELKAVNSDFRLAQRQFGLAQKQFREVTRQPLLDVWIELRKAKDIVAGSEFWARLFVRNRGERLSRNLVFEILISVDDFEGADTNRMVPRPSQATAAVDDQRHYVALSMRVETTLYPDRTTLSVDFPAIRTKPSVETSLALFRVYDENFAYPREGYGEVVFCRQGPLQKAEYKAQDPWR